MRVSEVMALARDAGVDRLDVQLLLAHRLQQPRAWLLAHDDHMLDDDSSQWLRTQLLRRAAGEPLAYLTGVAEFCGLQLEVTPATLIPRPETELLVDWAVELAPVAPPFDIIDLGTGSGAIALALKQRLPHANVTASDASADALAVAQRNAQRLQFPLQWLHGDWWQPVAGRRYALAVSNPPYIAGDDTHLTALSHEPRRALTPEGDGLAALRHIVDGAPQHLLPGGWLLLEHGHDQATVLQQLLHDRGFVLAQTRPDLADLPRCTAAHWPGTAGSGHP